MNPCFAAFRELLTSFPMRIAVFGVESPASEASHPALPRRDRPAGPRLKRFPRTSGCRGPLSPAQYGGFSPGRQTKPSSPVAGAGV